MNRWRIVAAVLAALLSMPASPAPAQTLVTSPAPDSVAVTIYRDPQRSPDQAPNLDWLNGYALITERRTIALPAGESVIRFEGVAGGIVPQSAIVTGFPDQIVERNRDAYLLSSATLLDRSLGQRVHLRRTSLATGEVREQEALIASGAGGAVVLRTAEGYESLRCTGLPEALIYDRVPAELSAKPTLSLRTRSAAPVTATIALSYMASGFDWQANYIAHLSPDGRRADLFAWLTLASTDETSFPDADTQAVAGNVNRDSVPPQPREGGELQLQCWPQQSTSDIPLEHWSPSPPPPPPPSAMYADGESIVVTGTRLQRAELASASPVAAMSAEQEELGDLKLYRIPEPVTVAARSQKQVALLHRPDVQVELVHRRRLSPGQEVEPEPTATFLVTRNRDEEGLGLPLPAGGLVLFASRQDRPIVLGEGFLADRAVDEDVEVALDSATGVVAGVERVRATGKYTEYLLTVSSDRSRPVRFEAEFTDSGQAFRPGRRLIRRDGMSVWAVTVPANGTARLRYRILNDEDDEDGEEEVD